MKKLGAVILVVSLFGLVLMIQAFLGQRETLVELSTLLSSPVRNTEGTEVGKIKQLLVNPRDGQIAYAVVATGGTSGFSEASIAIPWDAVRVAQDKEAVVLSVKREALEKAPRVEEGRDIEMKGREAQPQKKDQK